ncbi:MAG: hypothetical protein R3F35_09935 [Myxococcota bacterium]
MTPEELDAGQLDVAKRGLRAEMGGRKVLDLARELVTLSGDGLRRIAAESIATAGRRSDRGGDGSDAFAATPVGEVRFLEPLLEQIDKGISPGEEVLQRWRGEWDRDWSALIEATRF